MDGRFVEAGFGGFFLHRLGDFFHGDEGADFGFLALDDAAQVADVDDVGVSGLDGKDDLFGFAGGVVVEEASVDAAVGAFLQLGGACADKARAATGF